MTPKEYYEKHCSSVIEKDDFIQECHLAMLENPKEDPVKLFKEVEKRFKKQASDDFYNTAPHLYNDDGECIDDEIYFVENKRNKLTFERIDYFNRTFFRTNTINNLKSFKLKTKGVKI